MRKTLYFPDEIVYKIDELRRKKSPIPSFSGMLVEVVREGLSIYGVIDEEREKHVEKEKDIISNGQILEMKYCIYCRNNLKPKMVYCDLCGKKLV